MDAINALDIAWSSITFGLWFFDFPNPVGLIMQVAFHYMIHVAKRNAAAGVIDDDLAAIPDKGMPRRFLGDGAPVYRGMARDCMEVCSFVSDASAAHESVTFCGCSRPDLPPDVVRRCVFLWGSEESARMSRGRVLREHPGAEFIDVSGHNHCGYQCAHPDEYVALLDERIRGSR